MGRILLEGGIVVLLVLIGISVFIPERDDVRDVIVDFENSIENGEEVSDGELEDINIGEEDFNFIARINCEIGNTIIDGLNSVFELGVKFIRIIVN